MEQQNLNSFLWALVPYIFMLKTIILIIFDTKPFPLPEEWFCRIQWLKSSFGCSLNLIKFNGSSVLYAQASEGGVGEPYPVK